MFENPQPGKNEVVQAVDSFRIAVKRRLKSECCLPVTIDFPSHIFKHLFEGRGEFTGGWCYLEERHSDKKDFPQDWDRCLDSFGEGHNFFFFFCGKNAFPLVVVIKKVFEATTWGDAAMQ